MSSPKKISEMTDEEKLDKITDIIEKLEQKLKHTKNKEAADKIKENINSFTKINLMKRKLLLQQNDLKKKYLTIVKEKTVYQGKIDMIKRLGEEQNWKDNAGILKMVRKAIKEKNTNPQFK